MVNRTLCNNCSLESLLSTLFSLNFARTKFCDFRDFFKIANFNTREVYVYVYVYVCVYVYFYVYEATRTSGRFSGTQFSQHIFAKTIIFCLFKDSQNILAKTRKKILFSLVWPSWNWRSAVISSPVQFNFLFYNPKQNPIQTQQSQNRPWKKSTSPLSIKELQNWCSFHLFLCNAKVVYSKTPCFYAPVPVLSARPSFMNSTYDCTVGASPMRWCNLKSK